MAIKWHDQKIFVSKILRFDTIGLEEIGEGVWAAYFGPVFVGWLDKDDYRIMDVRGVGRRT